MPERSDLILRLTRSLADLEPLEPLEPLPVRLCRAFVRVVEGRGGAIAVGFVTAERTLLCATTDDAARYEDAQDLLREGPSLDAFRTGQVVVSNTPADLRLRWPALADAVAGLTPTRVSSIPMRPGHAAMGVLTVDHPLEVVPAGSVDDLQLLTNAIGAAIIGDLPLVEDQRHSWTQRDLVSQATGMVIAQLGIDPADALAVLRAHAYAEELSVVEVSHRVIERHLRFGAHEGWTP